MSTNNRDTDKVPIYELGFAFHAGNGSSSNIAIHCGAFDSNVSNSLVFKSTSLLTEAKWETLSRLVIELFDPDALVVTSHNHIEKKGGGKPIDVGGMFTYRKGGVLQQHPFA